MLKESTMKKYTVSQLAKHLDQYSQNFLYDKAYQKLFIEHHNTYLFYMSVNDFTRDALIELIKEHT
jgi:hypothetical protein